MDHIAALRAFVRLVDLGSFTAVAKEERIKQSTVSKWLATLEDEIGVTLVERTTRRQRVTDEGQLLYERAQQILGLYDEVKAELREQSGALTGRLRVSVPVVFGRLHVVPHLAAFARLHPELELELAFDDRYVNLLAGGIDVAIRVGTPADSSFRARTLASTPRRLVASPSYLDRAPPIVSPKDLSSHGCLLHTGLSSGARWSFRRRGRAHVVPVRGRLAANNSEALCVMAREGLGVALLASWLVDEPIAVGQLVALLPEYEPPPAPIQALLLPGRWVHPRVRAFVDHMQHALAHAFGGG